MALVLEPSLRTTRLRSQLDIEPVTVLFLALDVDLTTQRGEAIHARALARHLGARGLLVHLVTATPPSGVPNLGSGVRHWTRPDGAVLRQAFFCLDLAREVRASALYERRLSPKISYVVSRTLGIPFLIEVNGIEDEIALLGRQLAPWHPIRFRIRGRMYRAAAAVITVSTQLSAYVGRIHGLIDQRLVTIPNGVDLDRFRPGDLSVSRASLGLLPGRWIAFVGNLVPWQGVSTLIRAFAIVLKSCPDARLVIVGDGILRESLEAVARDLGVAEHVRFAGSVPHEQIPRFIAASTICAAPFSRERNERIGLSPLKLYEYLAGGRPVVASDVPGVREVLLRSGAGITVPPDNDQALSAALVSLLDDPPRANAMGSAGRTFAVNECSWTRVAKRVDELIRSVTRDARERGRNQ